MPRPPRPKSDTSPETEAKLIEGYRRMSHREKLEQVTQLTRTVRQLAMIDVRRHHPHAGKREHELRLAARWLDPELMRTLLGWEPDEESPNAH